MEGTLARRSTCDRTRSGGPATCEQETCGLAICEQQTCGLPACEQQTCGLVNDASPNACARLFQKDGRGVRRRPVRAAVWTFAGCQTSWRAWTWNTSGLQD